MVANKVILERDLEAYFSAICRKRNLLTLKLSVRYSRGWPDRLVALPNGKILWVELKRLGAKPSPLQNKVHAQLAERGHKVFIIDNKEDIDAILSAT